MWNMRARMTVREITREDERERESERAREQEKECVNAYINYYLIAKIKIIYIYSHIYVLYIYIYLCVYIYILEEASYLTKINDWDIYRIYTYTLNVCLCAHVRTLYLLHPRDPWPLPSSYHPFNPRNLSSLTASLTRTCAHIHYALP